MASDDDIAREIQRKAKKQLDRTIEIPDGLTEDEAVTSAIEQYKAMTGIELPEAETRLWYSRVCQAGEHGHMVRPLLLW
jgi:hypothetical protein